MFVGSANPGCARRHGSGDCGHAVLVDGLLITDTSHALPVQVLRNGLRTIAVGTGRIDELKLPYLPTNSDIVEATSGHVGPRWKVPPGYPVARVTRIDRSPDALSRTCWLSRAHLHLDRSREVLLVWTVPNQLPERRRDATAPTTRRHPTWTQMAGPRQDTMAADATGGARHERRWQGTPGDRRHAVHRDAADDPADAGMGAAVSPAVGDAGDAVLGDRTAAPGRRRQRLCCRHHAGRPHAARCSASTHWPVGRDLRRHPAAPAHPVFPFWQQSLGHLILLVIEHLLALGHRRHAASRRRWLGRPVLGGPWTFGTLLWPWVFVTCARSVGIFKGDARTGRAGGPMQLRTQFAKPGLPEPRHRRRDAGAVAVVLLLVWRMVQLQIVDHEHFTTLSRENRVKGAAAADARTHLRPHRACCWHRTAPAYSLEITPEQVDDLDWTWPSFQR